MDKRLEQFLEFEKEEQLFARTYSGVPYWQSIRTKVSGKLLFDKGLNQGSKSSLSAGNKCLQLLKGFLYDMKNWIHLQKCDVLYFDQMTYRRIEQEEKDTIFDYFDFENKYKVQRCFYLSKGSAGAYAGKGAGVYLARFAIYRAVLCSKFIPGWKRDANEETYLRELSQKLNQRIGLNLSSNELIQSVYRAVLTHRAFETYYKKLIKKTAPEAILIVCHYDDRLYPLCSVAKNESIPVIELEHGTVVNNDAYMYKDRSDEGKELPDYFFSYGDFWNQHMSLPEGVKVRSIGNPFLEHQRLYYEQLATDDKKIVFYSQPGIGRELESLAIAVHKKYCAEGYQVYYKLHPAEFDTWDSIYTDLKECGGIRILSGEIELYKLLKMAGHHVGRWSTVLFEAAIFDVQIYVYTEHMVNDYMTPLLKLGGARGFSSMEEFDRLFRNPMPYDKKIAGQLWKSNAKKNGQDALEEILNGGL